MPSIRILPTQLVNKIAAGEVIERPANIVKELVENALDAGARRIEIDVADGGKRSITVRDDGAGMSASDAALAFRPHATSKIATDEDLFTIETLGFRGEALASIGAVSHAHLRTRTAEQTSGIEVTCAGEELSEPRPCPASVGTTVTVRDLFFNTPARRKFLRKANTELGHITEHLARLALPRPDVAFRLTHNDRELQNLPATESTAARVARLFGPDLAESLLPVANRPGQTSVSGLIGPPSAARATGKWQYFFLNGRYIRDRLLAHALREAYRGRMEPSRWPVAFLFLETDPCEVDVNVHPMKIEVRFRDAQRTYGELLAALRETLNRTDLTPAVETGQPASAEPDTETIENRRESLREAMADFFKSAGPPRQERLEFPSPAQRPRPTDRPVERADRPPGGQASRPAVVSRGPQEPAPQPAAAKLPEAPAPTGPIQVHDSYIVTADADGIVIIDQHALHERILYNELTQRLTAGRLSGQRLLIPQTISATAREAEVLRGGRELLKRLGIEVAPFGPQTLAIQQFPSLLIERGVEAGPFLRELIDLLGDDPQTDPERLLQEAAAMMACKAAVKAGDRLGEAEIRDLLARRAHTERVASCPHGRPTTLRLSLGELAKQFHRT